jgi:hypothetical protein
MGPALKTAPRRPGLTSAVRGAVALVALTLVVGAAGPAPRSGTQSGERWIFPARPNVCGTGDGIVVRSSDGSTSYIHGMSRTVHVGDWRTADPPCESGVVVLELDGPQGARTEARLTVTSEVHASRPDAGEAVWLSADEAAARLLDDARTATGRRVSQRLVMAAALADTEVWPGLLELARDRSLLEGTRKSAIHWLGWQAASAVAPALEGMVRDPTEADEIRDAAVFALSQLPDDQAIPHLIQLVRTSDNARVRSRALFWLAEFDDPRAVAVFEEILAGPTG